MRNFTVSSSKKDAEYEEFLRVHTNFEKKYQEIHDAYHHPSNTGRNKTPWATIVSNRAFPGVPAPKMLKMVNHHKIKKEEQANQALLETASLDMKGHQVLPKTRPSDTEQPLLF